VTSFISIRQVSKSYRRGQRLQVLRELDLDVATGEFLCLTGPSGSGKTTLLNLIGGLDQPDSGTVVVAGQDLTRLPAGQLADWRARHVGFIFQMYHLLPALTAERNVEVPLLLTSLRAAERRRRVQAALELVGLTDRGSHRPAELSGGQQQRVAIARAIVSDPAMLVCDEPTGDLDRESSESILGMLQMLNHEHGKTIVMVTHDPRAAAHASRQVHLDKGRLEQVPERGAA
jgi:putative ABC transport system ATP-binding protein